MARERRAIDKLEFRASDKGPGVLVGYAAVFNVEATIGRWFREKIRPGAFANVLKSERDTAALVNHENGSLIGRRSAGTLRLSEDDVGLRYEIDVPDTSVGRDVLVNVKRGDLRGSSFQFSVEREEWKFSQTRGELDLREIVEISELYDVGPVTFPAYAETDVAARGESMLAEARSRHAEHSRAAFARRDARAAQFQKAAELFAPII
jgi:HK97 family phage prohead protease